MTKRFYAACTSAAFLSVCASAVSLSVCASAQAAPPASATSPASAVIGNATRGAALYPQRCGGCHSLEVNRVGPAHRGVVGRRAGTAPGFAYSPALKASGITFNEVTLDRWLINPQATVRGTRMFFRLGAAEERADIIAYLKSQPAPR
jgi:cytochrome c